MVCLAAVVLHGCSPMGVSDPEGITRVNLSLSPEGRLSYEVHHNGILMLNRCNLGVEMAHDDFTTGLELISSSEATEVNERYRLVAGKRQFCSYHATQRTFALRSAKGNRMDVQFSVSNGGVAFRYHFPGASDSLREVVHESSSFHFAAQAKGFLQPMSVAKTGWCETNNSYEEHYIAGVEPGEESPLGAGWVYPALFETQNLWVVLSETGVGSTYCASRLVPDDEAGAFRVGFPDVRETMPGQETFPKSVLPWATPWRLIVLGSLAQITESTLGTDLAEPENPNIAQWVLPGRAAWSWIVSKDDSIVYDVQRRYIDFAAQMKWEYCLVDVNWDRNIGYDRIAELAQYGKQKGVGLILWYNSSGDWNSTAYTPKSKLLTADLRNAEFARLQQMGIAGIKVDFFGGDGQSVMAYYHHILEDAARHHLAVNFHGATLPRGWQRTWPHLLTAEAIKGFEFITFDQENALKAPAHGAMLPFTRNLFDPMDFTPVNLAAPLPTQRVTTCGYELATSVVFTSGIQHFAESPEGMGQVPDYVRTFLQQVPVAWDDVRLIDGYPGKLVIIARKTGHRWIVAGLNGEAIAKNIHMDLCRILGHTFRSATWIEDSPSPSKFSQRSVRLSNSNPLSVELQPHGGFVLVVE